MLQAKSIRIFFYDCFDCGSIAISFGIWRPEQPDERFENGVLSVQTVCLNSDCGSRDFFNLPPKNIRTRYSACGIPPEAYEGLLPPVVIITAGGLLWITKGQKRG